MDDVWELFLEKLSLTQLKWNLEIINFVLMGNHYHIMLKTPDANIDKAMHCLNYKISLAIGAKSSRINQIFGGRYKWSLITSQRYFLTVYRYIYRNPIRAHICQDIRNYRYSSLNVGERWSNLSDKYGKVVIADDQLLQWFNQNEDDQDVQKIRKGLVKSVYKPVYQRKNRDL